MTSVDLFDRAGRALYGDQYVSPMAVLLGVSKESVKQWRAGKSSVPLGVWSAIAKELLARRDLIDGASLDLSQYLTTLLEAEKAKPARR